MSVSNGQKANATTFNNAYLSKQTGGETEGVIGLNNTSDPNSGDQVVNAQRALNTLFDADGTNGEADGNSKTYANTNFISDGQSRKAAIESLDAQLLTTNTTANDALTEAGRLRTLSGTTSPATDLGTFTGTTIPDGQDIKEALQDLETAVEARIPLSQKGAANGVATLDAGGKIPTGQIPASFVQLLGNWDASTNTPTLANGTGDTGDIYRVSVAGTVDFGAGNISFDVGDWVYYRPDAVWDRTDNVDAVTSVNGQSGIVVLDTDDVAEGSTNLYFTNSRADTRADARIAASSINALADVDTVTVPPTSGQVLKWDGSQWEPANESGAVTSVNGQTGTVVLDTDDVNEGAGNLYFTNSRADARIAAASINALNDVDTATVPPITNDVLKYNGTQWVPGTGGGGGTITSVNGDTGPVVVLDTGDIAEGSNLYFTNGRVDSRIATTSVNALADVDTTTTAPTSGQALVWNGTNWVPRTTGLGYGDVNHIANSDFEIDVLGWATYQDAAASTPVDGTGGSPGTSISRNTNSVTQNRGVANLRFDKSNALNQQGQGISVEFTIDYQDAEASNQQFISFDYKTSSAYETGDVRVFVYDRDSANLLTVINDDSGNLRATPSLSQPATWYGSFYPTVGNRNYRLIFHVATTETNGYQIYMDRVKVGPTQAVPGAIVTPWSSYTPTYTGFGTVTSATAEWRRVGSELQVRGRFTSGITTATEARISLPTEAGTSASTIPTLEVAGAFETNESPTLQINYFVLREPSVAYVTFSRRYSASSQTGLTKLNGNGFISSGSLMSWQASVPIQGWNAGALLSSTQTLLSAFKFNASRNAIQSIPNNTITKVTNWAAAGTNSLNATFTSGTLTIPRRMTALVMFSSGFDGNATGSRLAYIYRNGASVAQTSASNTAAAENTLTVFQTLTLNAGDTIEGHLFQNSGGALNSGTGASGQLTLTEIPDFSAFSVFGQTEYLEAKGTALTAWPVAANVVFDFGSVTLPPGEWDLTGLSGMNNNGAVTAGNGSLAITSTAGNSGAGFAFSDNRIIVNNVGTTGFNYLLAIPSVRVVVTTTTTYYLKGVYDATTTNLRYVGYKITARRIK